MFDRLGEAGGTVHVAAGEYTPVSSTGISFEGRDIQILGEPGAVLNCGSATAGFVANSGEPRTAVCASMLWLRLCVLMVPCLWVCRNWLGLWYEAALGQITMERCTSALIFGWITARSRAILGMRVRCKSTAAALCSRLWWCRTTLRTVQSLCLEAPRALWTAGSLAIKSVVVGTVVVRWLYKALGKCS